MKVLDLFSGIGGFSIGLEKVGFETVAFCEIEPYCRGVLERHWPDTPIYGDVKQLTGDQLRADGIIPDVIVGGYPCQPFSVAGKQRGAEDDRHLWPEVYRLVGEIRPSWCIFENVAGHIKLGLDEVLSDLEVEGYAARPFVIPACGVDAPHRRDRVWIVAKNVADTKRKGRKQSRAARKMGGAKEKESRARHQSDVFFKTSQPTMADTSSQRSQRRAEEPLSGVGDLSRQSERGSEDRRKLWPTEPNVGRVANGVPARSHRIKALGNAVVPQIPQIIGQVIMQYEGAL